MEKDTDTQRPPQIKATHLARKAVVSVRQSTDEQVQHNTGSTEFQRGQIRYPLAWGWSPERIEVIEDLGLSGSAAGHRPGYQQILAEVQRDEIGAIFVSDVTRIGREALELFRFYNLCRRHDVLVVPNGTISDTNDNAELLKVRLTATVAEYENLVRRDQFRQGRLTRAAAGHAVSAPPRAYVRQPDGSWIKDPDVTVQAVIDAIFREFLKHRTCKRTVEALIALGIRLPRRKKLWGVDWSQPEVAQLYRLLRHPAYCGDYVFRRRTVDARADLDPHGHGRLRRARPEEVILIREHYEPYVSPQIWDEVQDILTRNANTKRHQILGPGTALVQGIMRCGFHWNRAMSTTYKLPLPDGRRPHAYFCLGDYFFGGKQCGRIPGWSIDQAVREALFDRLSVPRLEVIRAMFALATGADQAESHRHRVELQRARYVVLDFEHRCRSVDAANHHVVRVLNEDLAKAVDDVQRLERLMATPAGPPPLDAAAFDELVALLRDLRALWNAPTTAPRDRKEIVRILIREVRLEERALEHLRLRINWADEASDTVIEVKRSAYTGSVIARLVADGLNPGQIAERLNAMGLPTKYGTPWSALSIAQRLSRQRRGRGQGGTGALGATVTR